MKLRLKRFFVDGFPQDTVKLVSEFLLYHGVGSVNAINRPDLQKIEIVCFYNEREIT